MREEIVDFIEKCKTANEEQLREIKVPWPRTHKELNVIVAMLNNRQHDYGTCVYAMSISALAAYYYTSSKLGATGFQASCANLDFIGRARHITAPFALIDANDLMYPQYDILEKVKGYISDWMPWAKKEAQKKLNAETAAAPSVLERWVELAALGV